MGDPRSAGGGQTREYVTVFEIGLDHIDMFPHFYARPSDFASADEMRARITEARAVLDSHMVRYVVRRARTVEESTTEPCVSLAEFLSKHG